MNIFLTLFLLVKRLLNNLMFIFSVPLIEKNNGVQFDISGMTRDQVYLDKYMAWYDILTLYLIETPLKTYANRADKDQAALVSLISVYCVCLWKYD